MPDEAQKQRILVIDDEQSVRRLIAEILQFAGYEVHQAAGGLEGVAKALEKKPGLILCDVSMPDLDGFGTLAAIRQQPALAATPFVFLTGRIDRRDMRQGMASGADDYITKPFNASELIESVRARLARHSELAKLSEKKLDDLRGNIVHMLPHELRTPLQGILGFADILQEEYLTMEREQIGDMARHILNSAQRLHRVVENFLVYAQIQVYSKDESKLADVRSQQTTIGQSFMEEVAAGCPGVMERQQDVSIWVKDATICSSRNDLKKVVEELLDNAVKFSEPGAAIQVSGWPEDQTFILTIQDYGRGMRPEQISQVGAYSQFDRQFYEQQGTGLGLVIARELMKLHGGQLGIESEPDSFTKVELRFPLVAAAI